jgi:hypothetical protein
MTPNSFKTLAGIGFDHHTQTCACQTFGTELIVQLIGTSTCGKRCGIDTFCGWIKHGGNIKRSSWRADR